MNGGLSSPPSADKNLSVSEAQILFTLSLIAPALHTIDSSKPHTKEAHDCFKFRCGIIGYGLCVCVSRCLDGWKWGVCECVLVCTCLGRSSRLISPCWWFSDILFQFKVTDSSLRDAHKSEVNGLLQFRYTYITKHQWHMGTVISYTSKLLQQFVSTWIMFPSLLPQFGSAFFSSTEGGVPVLLSI